MNQKLTNETIQVIVNKINPIFKVYEVQYNNGTLYIYGTPGYERVDIEFLQNELWKFFASLGYQSAVKYELGEYVIIVTPMKPTKDRIWVNVVLAIATFFTTMVIGSMMFGVDPINEPGQIYRGLPFMAAIMSILCAHEAGHYLTARRHGMKTSLPYFIPIPFPPIGTMGAVIKHKGPIPDRKALFDVGISGPLTGLVVSVIVTIIGLMLPPVVVNISPGELLTLEIPPLFEILTKLFPAAEGLPLHPVAFAGWFGMFITALNLIPAGQLDGGHVMRAMLGEKAGHISMALPYLLIALGFYVKYALKQEGFLWIFWGMFLAFFTSSGHPKPLNDDNRLDKGRMILGIVTFALGLMSITLAPFQVS